MTRSEAKGLCLLELADVLVVHGPSPEVLGAHWDVVWPEAMALADEFRARAAALGVTSAPVQLELFAEVRP